MEIKYTTSETEMEAQLKEVLAQPAHIRTCIMYHVILNGGLVMKNHFEGSKLDSMVEVEYYIRFSERIWDSIPEPLRPTNQILELVFSIAKHFGKPKMLPSFLFALSNFTVSLQHIYEICPQNSCVSCEFSINGNCMISSSGLAESINHLPIGFRPRGTYYDFVRSITLEELYKED